MARVAGLCYAAAMAKAQNKTRPTGAAVEAFLQAVEHPTRRADGLRLLELFRDWTGWPAQMWGPSIIGFGRYHYRYDSGREGEFMITGFSPRKANLSIYILPGYRDMSDKLARLGKHKIGKSCLYINKLADIDEAVLRELVEDGLAYMQKNYETWPA